MARMLPCLTAIIFSLNFPKVWNTKKEKGLSLKDSIKIEIPKELDIFKKDLVAMHHL